MVPVLKSDFYITTTCADVTKRLLYFVFVEVLSLKCHLLYISPDASFHSSWNDRLLFHFTVHFKLPVKAFGAPAEYVFQVFWFPDKAQKVILQH